MAAQPKRPRRGIERWLVLACALILLAPVINDARATPEDLRLPAAYRAGDDINRVLRRQRHARMVSIFAGLAARDVADGKVDRITVPLDLNDIADREPDYFLEVAKPAFNEMLIRQSSGATIEKAEYEVVLTDEKLAALGSRFEREEYPHGVVAFIGDTPEDRVYLHTDSERHTVYVVPASASEGGTE